MDHELEDENPAITAGKNLVLSAIAVDVRYLRRSFDEHRVEFSKHIEDDRKIFDNFIRPLWEEKLKSEGAQKRQSSNGVIFGWLATTAISVVAAVAAVKGIK